MPRARRRRDAARALPRPSRVAADHAAASPGRPCRRRSRRCSRGATPTDDIRALQQRLADLSYLPAEAVDGVPGEQTRFAVIAFQKWARLGRDGVVGPQTRAALAERRARRPAHARRRPARRGAARPPARARRSTAGRRTHDPRLARRRRDADAARLATASSARRSARGRCRSASGCRGRATSSAASPSTSTRTCRLRGLARLRADAALRREVAVRVHAERDAGRGAGDARDAGARALLGARRSLAHAAHCAAPAPPTVQPGVLTVGLSMPSQGFQAARCGRDGRRRGARPRDRPRAARSQRGSAEARALREGAVVPRLVARGAKPWDSRSRR